jgi:hypothetical protein
MVKGAFRDAGFVQDILYAQSAVPLREEQVESSIEQTLLGFVDGRPARD